MTQLPRRRRAVAATGATALLASLLVPAAATADGHDAVFISEIHYDNDGSDTGEAIEVQAPVGTDLTGWTVELYNGSGGTSYGTIPLNGTVSDAGVVSVLRSGIQNGSPDGLALVDASGGVVEFLSYEGVFVAVGGPADGQTSTDIGVQEPGDTPVGESLQRVDGIWTGPVSSSFGVRNGAADPGGPGEPDPVDQGACGDEATLIGAVQGSGEVSPMPGATVTVEGTVVGDFQHGGSYRGYYVQDAGDGDVATSDAVFVFAPGGEDVAAGDTVRVTGAVSEHFGLTEITVSEVDVCATDGALPAATELALPLVDHEPYEGMYVTFPQDLAILEYFEYGRYGEIVLGVGDETYRQYQPTAVHEPGSAEAQELSAHNATHRIMLDDGLGIQNPEFLRHPNGEAFTVDNRFRGGDTLTDVTGVLDYRFDEWGIQPTEPATHTATNPRPEVPEVGGTTTVASFNVLNYFTTLDDGENGARGANTSDEFVRQEAKIVAAINELDADVVGLIEIENNGVALTTLVGALNEAAGETRWAEVETGVVGSDAITTAFIYQVDKVEPVGNFALLHSGVDERFADDYNRPALAQTFEDLEAGGSVTVINNHLKSKGSTCEAVGDPTDPDGQGNCNGVRTSAAEALAEWAESDPTMTGTKNMLIIGDLNSYDKEDPIDVLREAGYTDLLLQAEGEYAYTYVFDGMLGYLDYAMADETLSYARVTGADAWAINADEPSVLDYDMTFKRAVQEAIYAADPYRSSDHDPVLVGLDLTADVTAPVVEAIVEPPHIWPANGKWRNVTTVVAATDDYDPTPTITLVGAESSGAGEIEVVSDSQFRVRAVLGASYTITYDVTDDSGNTTTTEVTVEVAKPGQGTGPGSDNPGKGKPGGR